MILYSREDLLSWRPAAPTITRRTRKLLFTLRLWRPRRARGVHTCITRRHAPMPDSSGVPVLGLRRLFPRELTLGCLNACSIRRKSAVLTDVLSTYDLDVFAVTESWHKTADDLSVRMMRPAGYSSLDAPRSSSAVGLRKQRGGGLVLLHKEGLSAKRLRFSVTPTTFELLGATLTSASSSLVVVVVYRPGGDAVENQFFDELTAVFEQLSAYSCPVVVTGDLNLHLDVVGDVHERRFHATIDTFGLQQFVTGPTHNDGHTLDVVVTRADLPPSAITVRPSGEYSDHSLVLFQLPLPRPALQHVDVSTRAWKTFDADRFRADLLSSQLCSPTEDLAAMSVDWLQDLYDSTLSTLLDRHAARRTVRQRHQPTTPWFDSACAAAKRRARMFERRYRRTHSAADRRDWIAEVRRKQRLYSAKQNSYWEAKIANS